MEKAIKPLLGLGLDAQYFHRYPNGVVDLCERYRDHLSHLSIVSLSSILKADKFVRECSKGLPVVHHLPGIAPANPDGPNLERLRRLNPVTEALDARWVCEDIAIWSIGPYSIPYFTPPIFEPEIADYIAQGIKEIQSISSAPFCAEVPSCAIVVGNMPFGEFFHSIVSQTNCRMVADVSHVYSYAIATKQNPLDVLVSLPLDAVWEIHISGGHIDPKSDQRYIDTHSETIPDPIIALLSEAVSKCMNLKAVTYEVGVGLSEMDIDDDVNRLVRTLNELGWSPSIS
ncbi:DUF692 family multinuclear iron-containing protein [Agrobacterium sp. CCNWLW32]|uniref:multinuclear nonheme iron-dependent oxidase n=1 Tax=unclassified Agrobacterium TaxID=2632611 RepID=UPI00300FC42C